MEEQEQQQGDQGRERAEKLVHHFEYDIDTQTLRTLDDYEEAEEEVAVTEIQLTDDGVEHYSYHSGFRGQTDNEKEEEKGKRQGAGITWAHDGSRFALTRSDQREVGDCGSSTRSATTGPSSSRTSTSCPARRTSRSRSCWCSNGGEVRARIAEMQKNLVR
jgi:hypothetical protein